MIEKEVIKEFLLYLKALLIWDWQKTQWRWVKDEFHSSLDMKTGVTWNIPTDKNYLLDKYCTEIATIRQRLHDLEFPESENSVLYHSVTKKHLIQIENEGKYGRTRHLT
jgi:hypothetical protein